VVIVPLLLNLFINFAHDFATVSLGIKLNPIIKLLKLLIRHLLAIIFLQLLLAKFVRIAGEDWVSGRSLPRQLVGHGAMI
jgi:hypothetical protein